MVEIWGQKIVSWTTSSGFYWWTPSLINNLIISIYQLKLILKVLANRYLRHASGEMYVISHALAKFISINRSDSFFSAASVVPFTAFVHKLEFISWIGSPFLRTYAHDDVSAGSWFIGLDVRHVDESKFCCSSWSSGSLLLNLLLNLSPWNW